jgi:sentrin-specific protease 8
MSFMLIQTADPLSLKDALPDFSKTTHIFLPINDCRNVEIAEGGSHWSLRLVSILDRMAFHYDSLHPHNTREAEVATLRLGKLLGKPIRFLDLPDSPQQDNSSDCGVFVCLQMRHLLMKRLLTAPSEQAVSMSLAGKEVDATSGRKEILKIIEGFRREGEKRRS